MKVLAIISRDLEKGSTKYRLAQYLDLLAQKDIHVDFLNRQKLRPFLQKGDTKADLIFNQKCLFQSGNSRKLFKIAPRILFDFDDAIYTRPGKSYFFITRFRVLKRLHFWLTKAQTVTTSSHYLASYARKFRQKVDVIPMALDLDVWKPKENRNIKNMTIGWAGAPVNVPLLERLSPVLDVFLKKHNTVKLAVFSGKEPSLSCPFEFHPFEPGGESEFVRNLDIGLLPLIKDDYAKGKSPIKAIQYLACGLPVVGNIFGATKEILNHENSMDASTEKQWFDSLESLILDQSKAHSMGQSGRNLVEKNHNLKTVSEKLIKVISGN